MSPKVIVVKDVGKKFKQGREEVVVIQNVTISFDAGFSYAITGSSGSGKSTLIQILAGFDAPTEGLVIIGDITMQSGSADQLQHVRNSVIGMLFQRPYLIRELTILENVCLPGVVAGGSFHDVQRRGEELLESVGIASYRNKKPGILSGGQQLRAALARALFNRPIFLIADEPTGSLDYATGNEIMSLLFNCQKMWGMGLIISTHDQRIAQSADYCYELKNGTLSPVSFGDHC